MQDVDQAVAMMEELERLGVQLSIDDFGTGYSSLAALKTFPVARLKIDKAFIKGLPDDEDDMAVATAVISLGQKLNLKVIAEGVETAEQADFLRRNHCDEMQGYCVSRPIPPDELAAFLGTGSGAAGRRIVRQGGPSHAPRTPPAALESQSPLPSWLIFAVATSSSSAISALVAAIGVHARFPSTKEHEPALVAVDLRQRRPVPVRQTRAGSRDSWRRCPRRNCHCSGVSSIHWPFPASTAFFGTETSTHRTASSA